MSDMRQKVVGLICEALEELNEERGEDEKIPMNEETVLFGAGSEIDSLELVSVIVDVETAVSTDFGHYICLTDDRAMSREPTPFTVVGALSDYIVELLEEADG